MLVKMSACFFQRFELGEIGIESAVRDREIQTFEVIRNVSSILQFRKSQPVFLPNDLKHRSRLRIEEILQADAEHHGNSQQRGQGGMHEIPLQLRKQRGRKPGMVAQLEQTHNLAESKAP